MPFWHRAAAEEREAAAQRERLDAAQAAALRAEAQARTAHDIKLLAGGGIPAMAAQRLGALKRELAAGGAFNSNLSPSETMLLHQGGCAPLGLVGGSAMYHVGSLAGAPSRDGELKTITRAYTKATELAIGRMTREAHELRAHGVVGVRLTFARPAWSEDCVEVQLLGTAIRAPGAAPKVPWSSDLPAQEWWGLQRAGYHPAGLVFGHCVWFAAATARDARTQASLWNKEFRHLSNALKHCRDLANGRVHEMARVLGAGGVAGVHLTRRVEDFERERGDSAEGAHVVTLSLVGTALRYKPTAGQTSARTGFVVSLRAGTLAPIPSMPFAVIKDAALE